jgi:hypothetical protein
MPQDYRRGTSGGAYGPQRTATLPFVAAGDDIADAGLKARAALNNPEPFTNEHAAAYYAFAGITDRITAVSLHRAFLTWDDVNDYSSAGIGLTAFQRMIDLRRAGVTSVRYRLWKSAVPTLDDASLKAYSAAALEPEQVVPYLSSVPDPRCTGPTGVRLLDRTAVSNQAHERALIPRMIDVGLTPEVSVAYQVYGVASLSNQIVLHRQGITADVIRDYRAARPRTFVERDFLSLVGAALLYSDGDPAIPSAVLCHGGTADDVRAWKATGQPDDRIHLYLNAGYTAVEVINDPLIRDADARTLGLLASLRAPAGADSMMAMVG